MANLFQAWDEDIQALGAAKASDDQIEARRQQLAEHFKAKAKAAGLSSKKIYETLDQFDAYSRQNSTAQDDQLTPEEQEMAQRVKDGTTRTGAIKEVGKAVKDAGIGALSSLAGWGGAIAQTAADVGENDKSELASQAAQGLYNVRDDLKSNYSEGTKLAQKDFWTPRGLAMGLAENAGQIAGSATVFGLAGKFAKAREFSRGATLLTAGTVGAPLAYSQGYGQGKENSLDEINKTSNAQLWENVKAEAKAYDDAGGTGEVPYLVKQFKEAGGDLNLMKDLMAENAGNRAGIMTVATEPLAMGVGSLMSRGAAAGGKGLRAGLVNAMNNQGMSNELARRIAAGGSAAIASQAGKIAATQMAREGVQETAQEGLEGYYAKGEGSRAAGRKGELNSADWSGENGIVQQGLQGGAIGLLMGAGGAGATLRNASKLALEKNGLPEKHDAALVAKEQADAVLVQAANIADANPNNIDAQNAYAEAQDAALVATNDLDQLSAKFNALYTPEEQAVIKAATMEGVAARKKVADDAAKAQKELDDAQAKEQADIAAQQAEAIKAQRDAVVNNLAGMVGDDVALSNAVADLGLSEEEANSLLTDAHKEAKAQKKAQKKAGQQNQSAPKTPFELAVDEAFDANGNRNKAASQDIADKHGIKNIKTLIDAISERIDSNETKNKAAANEALAQKRQKEKLENTLADFAANNDHDSMVNFLRDYEPTEADKLIKNAYASVENKKKAEQDAIAATKKAEALKVKESEAKTQAEQKKIAFNNDMANLYAANPDRNPTKAELDSVGKKHGVKSPIELAQAWVKAKNEAKAAKSIEGEYQHNKIESAKVTVTKTDKGYDIDWGDDGVESLTGKNAQDKTLAILKTEGYSKQGQEAAPKLAFPSPETATKDERDITVPTGLNINRDNIENSDKEPIIVRSNGQPFQTQEAAEQALKNKSTKKPRKNESPITPETHEVIPVDGGFAIAPVVEIQQPKKPDDNEDGGVIADAPKPNAPVSPSGGTIPRVHLDRIGRLLKEGKTVEEIATKIQKSLPNLSIEDVTQQVLAEQAKASKPATLDSVIGKYSDDEEVDAEVRQSGEVLKRFLPETIDDWKIDKSTFAVRGAWSVSYTKPYIVIDRKTGKEVVNSTTKSAPLDGDVLLSGDEQAIKDHIKERLTKNGITPRGVKNWQLDDAVSPAGQQAVSPTGEQVVDTAPTKPVEDDGIKTKHIKQPKPVDRVVYPDRDNLLTAIAKLKGLDRDDVIRQMGLDRADYGKRAAGLLGVFKKDGTGLSLDAMATTLSGYGYPVNEGGNTPYDNINGTPTPDALLDALRKALFGEDVGTEEYILNKYAAQREADQKEAEEMERLFNGKGSSTWDEADALDNVSNAIVDDIVSGTSGIAPEKLSETLKEVSNEPIIETSGQTPNAKTEARSPQNSDAETTGTGKTGQQESQSSTGQNSGIGLNQSFNLNAQTNEELAKRDADNKAAEAKRQAEEKAAKDKAQADKEVSDFRLSGSNAPADIAMAGGQKDMFAPPTRGEREAEKAKQDGRITPDIAANMKNGDIVRTKDGKEYLSLGARHDWLEVAPIVNGKSQVNSESTFKFLLSPEKASAYPERRNEPIYPTGKNYYNDNQAKQEATEADNAIADKAQPQQPALKKGEVGYKFSSGEVVLTATGRETTPFPKFDLSTNRKATNSLKVIESWLMDNAIAEAKARGDKFNLLQFNASRNKPQQADKDSAEMYLFDSRSVQPIPAPFMRQLVAGTTEPTPVTQPESKPTPTASTSSSDLGDNKAEPEAKQQPAKEEAPKQETNSKTPTLDKHNALMDSVRNGKASESDSVPIYRIDNKNFDANNIKPHGLYVSIPSDVSTFDSPHKDVGDTSFAGNASPKNPLNVESFKIQHKRGNDYPMEVSAGVSALKQLVSVQLFERLIKANKAELTATIKEQFPDIDTSQYYDAYELLEVLGAQLAIQEGYDAIIQKNGNDPFNEMVILDNSIIESMSPTDKPKFSRSTGLTTTQTRAILVKHFGEKLIKALESSGLLTIMATPPSWAEPDADGAYDKDSGKAYLFTDNLSAETVVATLAHELSGHKGFQELMTPTAYDSLMRQFNRLVKQGNPIALAAKARAEAAEVVTPTADTKEAIALAEKQTLQRQQDEYLPYLLTQQATLNATRSQQSAVTKVIEQVYRAVKAWLYRTLSAKGYDGLASKLLQPKDITLLAERMIREMGGDLSGKTPNELQERRAMIQGLSFMGAASVLGGGITLVDMSMKARDAKKIIDDILTKGKEGITPSKEFLAVIEKMANAKESVAARKRAASIVEGFITKLRGELLENSQLSGKIAINAKNIKTGEAIFIDAKDAHHESKRMFDAMTEQRKKIESQIVLAASMVESITGYKLNDLVIIPKPDSTIELLVGKQLTDGWREFGFVGASTEWQEGIKINVNAQTLIDLASGSSVIRAGAFSLIAHEMTHAIQHQLLPLNTRDSKVLGVDTFIPDGISAMHKAWLSENSDKYSSQEDSANYKAEKEGFDVGYTAAKAMLKKEGLPLRIISERDLENALLTAAQDTTSTVEALDKFNKANYSDDIRFSQLNTPQTQINAVRRKYEGTSQWMKAPNGKPTKLNEMQWLQVRTPNFKAWFGDWEGDAKNASKVVDENGEPMVVYHGTEYGGFTEFGSSGYGAASREKGFWFSNKIRALEYSGKNQEIEIVPVLKSWSDAAYFAKKLDVEFKKAPEDEYDDGIYFIDDDIASTLNQARNILQKAIEDKQPAGIYPVFLSLKTPKTINAKGKLATNINTLVMSNVPKKYDGMMIVDVDDAGRFGDYGYITDNYVAKTSTQIKSAIGNTGEFNQTNPDIRFSRTEQNPRSSSLDNFIAKAIAEKAWLTTEQINLLNSATTFDELIPLLDKVWNQYFEAKKLKNNNSTKTAVGVDNIKALIRSEVDSGHITKEHGDLALYFAEKNPALFDSLKSFSFQNDAETLSGNAVAGVYNVVDKAVRISRRTNGSPLTTAHEVLHHAEEFLPENIKSSIIKAWQNDLIRAFKSAENGSNRKTMLHAIIHSIAMGDMSAIEKAIDSMDGVIPANTYHLFNPSEYWAENASRLMNNRSKRQDTWIENARSWINGLIQTLKNALGLQNDAAILKGLRMVLSGSQLKEGGKGIDIDHVYNMKMLNLFSYIGKFNPDGAKKTKTSNEKYSRQSKNPITEGIKSAANDAKNSLPDPIAKSIDNFMAGRILPSSDMANITAKTELSIYKRTIGTQLNTALQNADFKKVYDMAQRYLQHVAVDAYAALKVAPNLLGKLESWSDLKRDVKKIWPANFIKQKADRAAVASVIFDETLNNELLSDADILKALTRDQRQIYKEARDAIQVSLENTAKSEMVRKLLAAEAINWQTVESLINQDLPVGQFAQAIRDLVESRIGGFKNELEAILDADPKIKEAFKTGNKNKLIPAQKKELKKAKTLKAQIETTEEALKSLNDVENRLGTLIEQGYAPLMRFGEYTLTVRDLDGKVKSFFMFESKAEQVRATNAIVARYGKTVKLETDMISKEEFKQFAGMTPETMALFAKETGMDKDEAYQHYLKHAIPARSAMTRMIKRKGTEGFSDDIQRVVASFVMSNARMSAKNIYAAQIEKSIQDIESGKSVKDQAIVMKENVFNPKENFAQLRNFLFLWNLGGSIFFGLLNMTQPYMQTLPHLSQYVPIGDATRAILRGSKIAGSAMKNGTAPKGYEAEYNRAVREGVVDPQNVFMLSGVERGKTGASNSAWGVITHTMGLIAQVTESFNRKAVFIASLQVAKQKGDVWLKKKGFNSAYDFAKDSVDQTQGVYDKANRSNWANTSVGAPLMVFKQFSINYVEQMVRMWKKEAASGDEGKKAVFLMLAMLASLSGVMGLPFIKDILDVSETTAAFLGNPVNIEREARLALGKDLADPLFNGVLNHFVFNNLGMDIQGRTGMPDLVPWSNALNPTLSAQGRINEFASIAGATGGLIEKGYDATQLIARGNIGTAALTLMPRSFTSAFTGGKMAVTNEVMDSKGNKLFDTTWDEGLVKFIDANPKRMADLSRTKSLEWKDFAIQDYMTTSFKQKIIAAMMDKDQAEVNKLMKEVEVWNNARSRYPVYIDLNTLAENANKKDQTFDAREKIRKGMTWVKNERPEM